ncbi:N2227-domain-containing protein [Microthyrium microscopicum]|uniref:N2227-domain-containing protein n=1 Tax=Microthyrium microscopicum TaxID=703497 RepID=A0A6A6UQ87_9PEZI|nr:N2227-domain-containing protein [Microthyrium microscopicum]
MALRNSLIRALAAISIIYSFSTPVLAEGEKQQVLEPGLDGTLNHIKYEAASTPPSEATISRAIERDYYKQKYMNTITDEGVDSLDQSSKRYWLLWCMYGFERHGIRYQNEIKKWAVRYAGISEKHRKIVKSSSDYEKIYDTVHDLWGINGQIAKDVVTHALAYYSIPRDELDRFILVQEYNENWDNQERVNEAIQHVVRDWATEGQHERATAMKTLTDMLTTHFPSRSVSQPARVLVPGAGLGRLAHEIAELGGFSVTANEWSAYMRLAYRYVTSLRKKESETNHPFLDWWSYQPSRTEMTRPVLFPDSVVPSSGPQEVVMVEGDWTVEFANDTAVYDAVVTFFFMDTATNMLDYMDTLSRVLKPGGMWINLGPLLYHDAAVEFSLEDWMDVAEKGYGFEFVDVPEEWGPLTLKSKKARNRDIGYMYHKESLRRNIYNAQLFAAVKKETDLDE